MRWSTTTSVFVATTLAFAAFACAQDDNEFTVTPSVTLGPSAGDLTVGPKMNAAGKDLRGSKFAAQDLAGHVSTGAICRPSGSTGSATFCASSQPLRRSVASDW